MTNGSNVSRRIAITAGVVVCVLVLAYFAFMAWIAHVTYASDDDCGTAQTIVSAGGAVADVQTARVWAATARARKDHIEHRRLATGVAKYITVVETTFAGSPLKADAKNDAFSDMFDACREIEVRFPTQR